MRHKRNMLTAMGAASIAVMASATAFACTVFKGTMTVRGNASSVSVTSSGTGTGMSQTLSSGIAKATKTSGTIVLSTGSDAYGRKIPANNYAVRYYNSTASAPGYTTHYQWNVDCMWGGPGSTKATVTVGSDGKVVGQPKTISIGDSVNTDSGGRESTLCLSDNGGAFGNQVPLTIVL